MRFGNLERMAQAETVLRVLSFGGGVQSSTLLMRVLHGEMERPDAVIFADPKWESAQTYDWIAQCEAACVAAGLPFYRVSAGDIRESALDARLSRGDKAARFASLPLHVSNEDGKHAMLKRQCTKEFKIEPLVKKERELLGVAPKKPMPKTKHCEVWIGISTDEAQRMSEPRDAKWQTHFYPIIEWRWSRADCANWLAKHGYNSVPKSACLGCPFQDNNRWREMKNERPEEFADAVEFDALIRDGLRGGKHQAYLHRSRLPLDEVDFRNAEDMGQLNLMDGLINDGLNEDCSGMCGV